MLKNWFNKDKKETQQQSGATVAAAEKKVNFSGKPSAKKKNTYIVQLNTMTMSGAFGLCDATPLAIVKINGATTDNANGGFMSCTQFPNPGASIIDVLYNCAPEWRIILGDKMASTIIEYLDKETLKPVLMLYPNGSVQSLIPGMDENTVIGTRLNHASRRDFVRQYNHILAKVQIVNPLIEARNHAMKRAPKYATEAYAKFVAELNQQQIEQAKQIMAQRQK